MPLGMRSSLSCMGLLVAAIGCSNQSASPDSAATATAVSPAETGPVAAAEIGKAAPDFTLPDTNGQDVSLASFKGKTVVLEWYNPECPYVVRSHTKGSLKGFAERAVADGVAWLTINSGAPGKQGAGAEKSKEGAEKLGIKNTILLDQSGEVGTRYGATNTPHMYVIDPEGTLVYAGAIDNSPDGEGESPEGGRLVNYVADALLALREKRDVAVPHTKAYGCSVKYPN
jgi:peroxiredoxin